MSPVLVQAGTFSFIDSLFAHITTISSADVSSFNSQTMPLLAAAVNLEPKLPTGGGDITVVDGTALLPDQGPSGTAADIQNQPATSQISVYTVRSGDTLSQIAKMFKVSVNTIVWANDIKNGVIQPGESLIILPVTGIQHTIVKGETLESLAKTYKSNAHDIAQYNNLAENASLVVGTPVIIPSGEIAAPAPAAPSHSSTIKSIAQGTKTEPFLGGSGPALSGFFAWPVEGGIITQGIHGWNAVDIGAPRGTAIFASAAGEVIIAKSNGGWNGGYGNYVVVSHANGTQTLYAHMSKVAVSAGETVAQGDKLGSVGATGEATGPHLHFEVRGATNPFVSLSVGYKAQ